MATTYAALSLRIDNELSLLGSFDTAVKQTLITDALTEFCRLFEPEISANLSITANTAEYSIPDTIEKISAILNASYEDVVYALDSHRRKITLQDTEDASATYVVYGTPRSLISNYSTVIGALSENCIDVLWAFIVAHCHSQVESDRHAEKMQIARGKMRELKQDRNRNPDAYSQTMQFRDVQGNVIDDASNADGISPDIDDFLESDL